MDEWGDLEAALKGIELSTIDYGNLRPLSEQEFVTHLVEREISEPVDAVVIIGRRTHFLGKTPPELKASLSAEAKLYYLRHDGYEYSRYSWYGDEIERANKNPEMPVPVDLAFEINEARMKPIPDSITYLVQDLRGTVLSFSSSHEFGRAIERLPHRAF